MSIFKVHVMGHGPYHVDAEVFHNKRRYAIIRFGSGKTQALALSRACDRVSQLEDMIGALWSDAVEEEKRIRENRENME